MGEMGIKAAIAAIQYAQLDPDRNGTIEAGDIAKMFGKIASSCPDMTAGKAAGIAQLVMSDANDPEEGGHPSLNFTEYFTCVEGDSMTFDTFLESIDEVDNAEIAAL